MSESDAPLVVSDVPPPADASEARTTVPGPPLLPTGTDWGEASPARASERDEANWLMVRSSLSAMSEQQATFLREQKVALEEFFRQVDQRLSTFSTAINERLNATDSLLVGRFNGIDERLDEHKATLGAMNQILTGVRHATDSALDMATTAARDIKEVARRSIPEYAPPPIRAVPGTKQEDGGG